MTELATRHRFTLLVLALLGTLSGCIWGPNNRSDAESTDAISLSGFTFVPGQYVKIQVSNVTTGTLDSFGTATTGSTPALTFDGGMAIYPWSKSITPSASYWAPQISGAGDFPYALGRIEIFPTLADGGESLYTFNASQNACMTVNGVPEGPLGAFGTCGGSTSLVLFDNTGVNTAPQTAGLTRSAPQTFGGVTWELDTFAETERPPGDPLNLTVDALVCFPSGSGPFPVQIYNHGGYTGLAVGFTEATDAAPATPTGHLADCLAGAENGWLTAMTAYRGESVTLTNYSALTQPPARNPLVIETCLGEVTDVLRFTSLVLALPQADPTHVLMWGWSHGGCITWRAVEQGAPVQAAATFASMNDVGALAQFDIDAGVAGAPPWPLKNGDGVTNPADAPYNFYNWRSPIYPPFGDDLNARTDVKMLMLQGVKLEGDIYDDGTLEPGVGCELANLLSPASTNVYVNTLGVGITGPPPDCPSASFPSLTWEAAGTMPLSWTWPDRTFIEVNGADHSSLINSGAQSWTLFVKFVESLGWASAPYSPTYVWQGG